MTRHKFFALLLVSLLPSAALTATPSLTITGSDTLAPLVTAWLQDFKSRYSGLRVEVQSTGSATVPTALAEGTVDIGVMSRQMTPEEISEFVTRRGFAPQSIPIARDALVVIVNKQNPINSLTLDQLDRIFSANARCSGYSSVRDWHEFTKGPATLDQRIEAFSRTATSGSHGFFKSRVLCEGDYAPRVVEFEGFAALVDSVANTLGGIGYTGLRWVDDRVKPLALSTFGADGVPVTSAHADYPLTRDMYFYWAQAPSTRLSPILCAFINYSQSLHAQELVASHGLTPIAALTNNNGAKRDACD